MSPRRFTLFALLALLALSSVTAQSVNIAVGIPDENDNEGSEAINDIDDGWVAVPEHLQHIGGNGNGDWHWIGALQTAGQAIADHARRLGLFTTSNATITWKASRRYTFSAQKVGNYSISITLKSSHNEVLNANAILIISNSGNWLVSHYDFQWWNKNQSNHKVADLIKVSYDANTWRYDLINSSNKPNGRVWNVELPALNTTLTLQETLLSFGWSDLPLKSILRNADLQWILRYGANFVLTQAYENGYNNMTVLEPSLFKINKIWSANQLKHSKKSIEYEFDIQVTVAKQQSIRLSFHINRSTWGIEYINLDSWSIAQISVGKNL